LKWVNPFIRRHQPPHRFDVVALWDWEFDDDFIHLLLTGAYERNLSARAFHTSEFSSFAHLFPQLPPPRRVIDRASDVQPALLPMLSEWRQHGSQLINDAQQMVWCKDKATMHLELVQQGIPVPHGIILSRQDHVETAVTEALQKLGSPFVVKPAEGGGGEGVILEAQSIHDLHKALAESKSGKIILQKRVQPTLLNGRRAWFRVFYVQGQLIPCWWDDLTHLYKKADDLSADLTQALCSMVRRIAAIAAIPFFSSEIALTAEGELFVIDFVNEMCDMRLQSRHKDGVPNELVHHIIHLLLSPTTNR
jgi:hypothetical protein